MVLVLSTFHNLSRYVLSRVVYTSPQFLPHISIVATKMQVLHLMGYCESAVRIRVRIRVRFRIRIRIRFRVRFRVGLGLGLGLGLDSVRGSTISHKMKYLPTKTFRNGTVTSPQSIPPIFIVATQTIRLFLSPRRNIKLKISLLNNYFSKTYQRQILQHALRMLKWRPIDVVGRCDCQESMKGYNVSRNL